MRLENAGNILWSDSIYGMGMFHVDSEYLFFKTLQQPFF